MVILPYFKVQVTMELFGGDSNILEVNIQELYINMTGLVPCWHISISTTRSPFIKYPLLMPSSNDKIHLLTSPCPRQRFLPHQPLLFNGSPDSPSKQMISNPVNAPQSSQPPTFLCAHSMLSHHHLPSRGICILKSLSRRPLSPPSPEWNSSTVYPLCYT